MATRKSKGRVPPTSRDMLTQRSPLAQGTRRSRRAADAHRRNACHVTWPHTREKAACRQRHVTCSCSEARATRMARGQPTTRKPHATPTCLPNGDSHAHAQRTPMSVTKEAKPTPTCPPNGDRHARARRLPLSVTTEARPPHATTRAASTASNRTEATHRANEHAQRQLPCVNHGGCQRAWTMKPPTPARD